MCHDSIIIQDNDRTVVSTGKGVFPDPQIATKNTIYKGKIVVIKNISKLNILITGQNNNIT